MLDLWYSEFHAQDVKFSIKIKKHIHHEKTEIQQIDFFDSDTFGIFFTLDGLMMVSQKDEFAYHDMIVHPAFAVNPAIKNVLIIGGGDGGTAREVCMYPGVKSIDLVEIDRRVVELCIKYLPQTSACLMQDTRIHLHYQDGLEFVKAAKKGTYDLIIVDSTDPVGPGEGLFSLEFYENCSNALQDYGILINQHESPYYHEYAQHMKRSHEKLKKAFPIAMVYQFHMPTYPSGHWLFGFASKKLHPIEHFKDLKWQTFRLNTMYYNTDIHKASFALPTYVKELLDE